MKDDFTVDKFDLITFGNLIVEITSSILFTSQQRLNLLGIKR
jgi:hypothetical protein